MSCMEVLGRTEGRDLGVMVGKLDEDGRGFMGGRLEDWGDRVERVWKDGDSVQNRERATKDEGAKEQEEAKTI